MADFIFKLRNGCDNINIMELKLIFSFLVGVFSTICFAVNHSEKKDVEGHIYSNGNFPIKSDNLIQHRHHHRRHHIVQQAQRRDNLGFLKTFTEENLHFNKLFKEKLARHRHLKEKNFIGSIRAKVEQQKPILVERYNEAEDDDNVDDEDEMAEISQHEKKVYLPTRFQNSNKYKYGGRSYGNGIKVYDKSKHKETVEKIQKSTYKTPSDVDETSTSGEELIKTDSQVISSQNIIPKVELQKVTSDKKSSLKIQATKHMSVQQKDIQQLGVRKHSMSTHSNSPMKNLARIPILPILPLPLLYSSGDQETSTSSSTDDVKTTNEIVDNYEVDQVKVSKEVDQGRVESGNEDHTKKKKKENHVSGDWVDKLLAADQESNGFDEDDDFDEESEEMKWLGKNVTRVEHNSSQKEPVRTVQQVLNMQGQQSTIQQSVLGNSKYQQVLQFNGENRFSNRNDNFGKTFSGIPSSTVDNQYNSNNKNVSLIGSSNVNNLPSNQVASINQVANNNQISSNNQVASNLASINAGPYYTQSHVELEQPFATRPLLSNKIAEPPLTNNIVSSQFQSNVSPSQFSTNTVLSQTSSYIASPQILNNIASTQTSSNSALTDLTKETNSLQSASNQAYSQPSSSQYLLPQSFNDPNAVSSGTSGTLLSTNVAQFNNIQQKYDLSPQNLTLNQFNYPVTGNQQNFYTTNDKSVADNNIWKSYNIPLAGNASTIESVYIIPQGNNANAINSPQILGGSNINSATSSNINNNYGVQNENIVTSEDQNECASSCPSHCAPSCDQVCCTKSTIALDQTYMSSSIKYPSPKPLFLSEVHSSHSLPIGATPELPSSNEIISGPNAFINRQPDVIDLTKVPQNDNLMFMNAEQNLYSPQSLNRVSDFNHDAKVIPAFASNEYVDNHNLQNSNINQQLTMELSNKFQGNNIISQQFSNGPISNPIGQSFFHAPDDKKTTFSLQPMKPYFLKVPSLSIVHLRKDMGAEKSNNVKYPNPACFKGCRTNCLPHCSNYCCGVDSKRSTVPSEKKKVGKKIP